MWQNGETLHQIQMPEWQDMHELMATNTHFQEVLELFLHLFWVWSLQWSNAPDEVWVSICHFICVWKELMKCIPSGEHLKIWHAEVIVGRLNSSPMHYITLWGCVTVTGFSNDFRGKTGLWNTKVRFLELYKTYWARWWWIQEPLLQTEHS